MGYMTRSEFSRKGGLLGFDGMLDNPSPYKVSKVPRKPSRITTRQTTFPAIPPTMLTSIPGFEPEASALTDEQRSKQVNPVIPSY